MTGAPDRPWHVTAVDTRQFIVANEEQRYVAFAISQNDRVLVFIDGDVFEIDADSAAGRRRGGAVHTDVLMSPMPATVTRLLVAEGDHVTNGDTLALLEAMKMELPIRAPRDATVRKVSCREGDLVQPNDVLIELE